MSGIDRRADTPLVDWSDLAVSGLLPTGTVTLLLADVEGSTRLWETQPEEMTVAIDGPLLASRGKEAVAIVWSLAGVDQDLRPPATTRRAA